MTKGAPFARRDAAIQASGHISAGVVAEWCVRRGNYGFGARKQSACRAPKSRVRHCFPDRRRPCAIDAEVLNAMLPVPSVRSADRAVVRSTAIDAQCCINGLTAKAHEDRSGHRRRLRHQLSGVR